MPSRWRRDLDGGVHLVVGCLVFFALMAVILVMQPRLRTLGGPLARPAWTGEALAQAGPAAPTAGRIAAVESLTPMLDASRVLLEATAGGVTAGRLARFRRDGLVATPLGTLEPLGVYYRDSATGTTARVVAWDGAKASVAVARGGAAATVSGGMPGVAFGYAVTVERDSVRLKESVTLDAAFLSALPDPATLGMARATTDVLMAWRMEGWVPKAKGAPDAPVTSGVGYAADNGMWVGSAASPAMRARVPAPTASDGAGRTGSPRMRAMRVGTAWVVAVGGPWAWLSTATAPVTLDPTLIYAVDISSDGTSGDARMVARRSTGELRAVVQTTGTGRVDMFSSLDSGATWSAATGAFRPFGGINSSPSIVVTADDSFRVFVTAGDTLYAVSGTSNNFATWTGRAGGDTLRGNPIVTNPSASTVLKYARSTVTSADSVYVVVSATNSFPCYVTAGKAGVYRPAVALKGNWKDDVTIATIKNDSIVVFGLLSSNTQPILAFGKGASFDTATVPGATGYGGMFPSATYAPGLDSVFCAFGNSALEQANVVAWRGGFGPIVRVALMSDADLGGAIQVKDLSIGSTWEDSLRILFMCRYSGGGERVYYKAGKLGKWNGASLQHDTTGTKSWWGPTALWAWKPSTARPASYFGWIVREYKAAGDPDNGIYWSKLAVGTPAGPATLAVTPVDSQGVNLAWSPVTGIAAADSYRWYDLPGTTRVGAQAAPDTDVAINGLAANALADYIVSSWNPTYGESWGASDSTYSDAKYPVIDTGDFSTILDTLLGLGLLSKDFDDTNMGAGNPSYTEYTWFFKVGSGPAAGTRGYLYGEAGVNKPGDSLGKNANWKTFAQMQTAGMDCVGVLRQGGVADTIQLTARPGRTW